MAYRALIFGTDELYPILKPFYDKAVERGDIEIVAGAEVKNGKVNIVYFEGRPGGGEFS